MALGVLNNISAIYAQNNLANTQASLSKTLQQLSSGSRINSGADDAAGLHWQMVFRPLRQRLTVCEERVGRRRLSAGC